MQYQKKFTKLLKYHFPTSLEHLWPEFVRYIVIIGLVIAIMASVVQT